MSRGLRAESFDGRRGLGGMHKRRDLLVLACLAAVLLVEVMLSQAWPPRAALGQDDTFRLRFVASDGTTLHEIAWAPFGGEYPTGWWPAGGIVRDVLLFKTPGDMQPGQVSLVVSTDGLSGSVQAGTLEIVP